MIYLALLACLFLAGCGRYGDFQLPVVERTPAAGQFVWEPQPGPVLKRGPVGDWDSSDALNPSIVRTAQGYFNFYSGFDGKTWHTGLATSPDGLTWTKAGKGLSPAGWEGDYIAANGSALQVDGQFLYWYQAGKLPRIGLARSSDGRTWTKSPQPVLDPGPRGSWDERGVADPYVIRLGGAYYMFYLGQDRARRQRLGVARSADGATWTKLRANPVLELGGYGAFDENGLGEPAVWYSNGSYWMLYTGRDRAENRRMGFARSQNGVEWEKVAVPVISGTETWNAKVVCDATVEVQPEGIRVWFGGGDVASPDERLNGQIGFGVLRWQAATRQ
ncbi:MAG: hypothetical protein U0R19_39635 [Bryobacteraceae bacterium]